MDGITIPQAIDLGKSTLEAFNKDALEMALKHQTCEVANKWFAGDKVQTDGGDRVERHISLRDTGNAQHVRMYETDTPNVSNVDETIKVEWTHAQTSFSYSTKELAMNRGNPRRVYSLIKQRRDNMYREFADLLEEAAWAVPTGASDDRRPYGLPGWITQATSDPSGAVGDFTAYTAAFQGVATTFNVGGIASSSSINPRWANYNEDHNGVLNDTLLKRLARSFRKSKFQSPMFASQTIDPKSNFSNFRLYTGSDVLDAVEEIARKSDDRLGSDLGKYAGSTIFKGVPFRYVDVLDDTQTYTYGKDPIFGINHNHFYPVVLDGEVFKLNDPMSKVGQHNVLTVYLDLTYAFICDNRRTGGFLISEFQGT